MFRFRRYRVYIIFAIIAVGALYHFTTIDGLEGAGAASVERLKQFGPNFDSTKAKAAENKPSPISGEDDGTIAMPSRVDSGQHAADASATGESGPLGFKGGNIKEVDSDSKAQSVATSAGAKDLVKEASETGKGAVSAAKETGSATKGAAAAVTATATAEGANPIGHPKTAPKPMITNGNTTSIADGPADPIIDPQGGEGRLEIIGATDKPKIHWTQLPEHFPVPTGMIIQLPTGKPKTIPKVQFDFQKETAVDQIARTKKLDSIREVFSFSWSGYRKKAWMQDELSPLSGKYRNPFCAWGATLVDSLDTLWMMDLKEEFSEAVEAVKDIDFTTSIRNDIPLFETVIRYLGGLVAAYDISGGVHKILLDKAVELADVLIGAFDTPNRMPMTFYLWKPTFASQPHRAKTRVVLAELGSLSMEFTRLAQITKEARYYDAIARITNELEIWQPETKVPGLWPQNVDASGCKKPDMSSTSTLQTQKNLQDAIPLAISDPEEAAKNPNLLDGGPAKTSLVENKLEKIADFKKTSDKPADVVPENTLIGDKAPAKSDVKNGSSSKGDEPAVPEGRSSAKDSSDDAKVGRTILAKRDLSGVGSMDTSSNPPPKKPDCEPQGLASPPHADLETFTMGGQADSTYEYLPKEYLLLGGLEEKYRTMYEMAANATRERLLYRPMIPDEDRYILHAGLLRSRGSDDVPEDKRNLTPEGTHLTCFVGGMFALGAKIFDIKADMSIAKKLTDGCVWAYESTTTGIMPEIYETVACVNPDKCFWNETLWQEKLDPYGDAREIQRAEQKKKLQDAKKDKEGQEQQRLAREKVATALADSEDSGTEATVKKEYETVDLPSKSSGEPAKAPLGKSTIDKDSTAESTDTTASSKADTASDPPKMGISKRQLGEVDDTGSTDKLSESVKEKAAAHVKSVDSSDSLGSSDSSGSTGSSATAKEKVDINPTGSIADPLKEAKAPESSAAKSNSGTPTTGEHQFPGVVDSSVPATSSQAAAIAGEYEPPPIPTREEFVASRIKTERLPLGMTRITEKHYILRPEAIESVFIMYRITGDNYWREKGWKMFQAIEKYTVATYGASAISDVTVEQPAPKDEMESFWLAETLKYFYLLFSDPSHVSLDDYVL